MQWYDKGERNTKYFMNLEKLKQSNKTCKSLYNEKGNVLTCQHQILTEQLNFYRKLYTSDHNVTFTYQNLTNTKGSDEDRAYLDEPLRYDEFT